MYCEFITEQQALEQQVRKYMQPMNEYNIVNFTYNFLNVTTSISHICRKVRVHLQ